MAGSIFDYTSDHTPKASPSWAVRIGSTVKRLFDPQKGAQPQSNPESSSIESSTSPYTNSTNFTSLPNLWRVINTRKESYNDIERMDDEDELVNTGLDIIADFTISYDEDSERSFRVDCKGDAESQAIIDAVIKRLDLQNELWQIVRGMVKYGNEMREVIIDQKALKIVGLKQTISYHIYPRATEKGDKLPGWLLITEKDVMNGSPGQPLEEWQICPFTYGAKRGLLAVPILAAARRNWSRLSKIEDGMAIARLCRAYDKIVHRVPIRVEWTKEEIMATIKRYRDSVTKRKLVSAEGLITASDSPMDVETDYYLPDAGDNRGSVEVLNSTNLQLGNLNDIYYHRERLLSRLRVPVSYLQISSAQKTHLKSGSVGDADIQFARMIRGIHANLRRGLKRLFDMELLLNGKDPNTIGYAIELPKVETDNLLDNAKIELTMAQAAAYFVEAFGALPPALIASKWLELEPEQQKLMDMFLSANADKILKARMAMLVSPGGQQYKGVPGGGGSTATPSAKTKVARSKAQQAWDGEPKVPLNQAVDLMVQLHEMANQSLREAGVDVPEVDSAFRDVVERNMADIAIGDTANDEN